MRGNAACENSVNDILYGLAPRRAKRRHPVIGVQHHCRDDKSIAELADELKLDVLWQNINGFSGGMHWGVQDGKLPFAWAPSSAPERTDRFEHLSGLAQQINKDKRVEEINWLPGKYRSNHLCLKTEHGQMFTQLLGIRTVESWAKSKGELGYWSLAAPANRGSWMLVYLDEHEDVLGYNAWLSQSAPP